MEQSRSTAVEDPADPVAPRQQPTAQPPQPPQPARPGPQPQPQAERPPQPSDHVEPALHPDEPRPTGLPEDHSGISLSRIVWSMTTLAFLIAMLILGLRGDMGYAGVTLAVALAAAINLF